METTALSQLQDTELCIVMTDTGEREAYWRKSAHMFVFTDGAEPKFLKGDQVEEWMPAAKF